MTFPIKRHDLRPYLTAQFFESDEVTPAPLTDATKVTFVLKTKNAAGDAIPVIERECSITDAALGKITFEWQAGDTDTAGDYEYEFEIDWNGEPQTVPPDGFLALKIWDDASTVV